MQVCCCRQVLGYPLDKMLPAAKLFAAPGNLRTLVSIQISIFIAMSRHEDSDKTLTIDFNLQPETENAESDWLKESSLFAEDLLREVSESDTAELFCEPEPPLPFDSPIEEKRSAPRFLVNWKVVVMNENNGKREFFHGRARDISMGGLCLLSDHNLVFTDSITVLISVPPDSVKHKPYVIEVRSKISNTVLANNVRQFRIGIRFIKFKDGDKRFLEQYLTERYDVFS